MEFKQLLARPFEWRGQILVYFRFWKTSTKLTFDPSIINASQKRCLFWEFHYHPITNSWVMYYLLAKTWSKLRFDPVIQTAWLKAAWIPNFINIGQPQAEWIHHLPTWPQGCHYISQCPNVNVIKSKIYSFWTMYVLK